MCVAVIEMADSDCYDDFDDCDEFDDFCDPHYTCESPQIDDKDVEADQYYSERPHGKEQGQTS